MGAIEDGGSGAARPRALVRRRGARMGLVALAGVAALAPAAAGCTTTGGALEDLGTLPGAVTAGANSISGRGLVAGGSDIAGNRTVVHPVLVRPGQPMLDLGDPVNSYEPYMAATAVNDQEVVVGTEGFGGAFNPQHAFRWDAGQGAKLLPSLGQAAGAVPNGYSRANDVNGNGDIAGQDIAMGTGKYDRTYSAVVWSGGVAVRLAPPAGGATVCEAVALNDVGDVVGTCGSNAVLWRGAAHEPVDLGPGTPTDINDQGLIVGQSAGVASVWAPGATTPTPLPGGATSAAAVNDRGVIVGNQSPTSGPSRALRWDSAQAQPRALPDLGFGATVSDVDDDGVAVGQVRVAPDGSNPPPAHAARWKP